MDAGNRIRISSSGDIIIGNRMMKLIASSILAISFMMMMFWSKNGGADTNIYGTAQHRQLSIPLQQCNQYSYVSLKVYFMFFSSFSKESRKYRGGNLEGWRLCILLQIGLVF